MFHKHYHISTIRLTKRWQKLAELQTKNLRSILCKWGLSGDPATCHSNR